MIRFTRHAETRLRERKIAHTWVSRTLLAPDKIEPDLSGPGKERAFRAIPEAGGKVLRVVYTRSGADMVVVTAFFDRNA